MKLRRMILGDWFCFSPDGRLLVTGSGKEVRLRIVATGEELWRFENPVKESWFMGAPACVFSPEGRTLAWSGGNDRAIRLYEVATGQERRRFEGHGAIITSFAFSPDGRRLLTGSRDSSALVWEVRRSTEGSPPKHSAKELEAFWADLADGDAEWAYRAILTLAGSPDRSVAFLKERLRPVEVADPRRVGPLLAALDGDNFAERERAARELEGLGFAAEPALRRVLLAKPSLEVRLRVERILSKWMLRAGRVLEVLELAGTAEAQRLVQELARGAPESRLTQEAKASPLRLVRQPTPKP